MEAKIVSVGKSSVTVQVTIPLTEDMLDTEKSIQSGVNYAGMLATQHALSRFDTDGSPIKVEGKTYTSKGRLSKTYQCPFGEFELDRHVYQPNEGGRTYCPLDNDARILIQSTPKFAQMVSQKYAQAGSMYVQRDLRDCHDRHISRTYIQDISSAVGEVASSKPWKYTTGVASSEVVIISFSLDGTCMFILHDGWRQAMVGSISLYDESGERLHTSYLAQAPEYGKEKFLRDFKQEIETTKKLYSGKTCIGVADGAGENWKFLQPFVDMEVLDFYHATEYLAKVSRVAFKPKEAGKKWLKQSCHTLKHEVGGAEILLKEMKELMKKKLTQVKIDEIGTAVTYFTNHLHQMNYADYLSKKLPIGSGVIEAACKVIIKQRMCNSGMKWTEDKAKDVLTLRCFNETDGKWEQFWKKIKKNV